MVLSGTMSTDIPGVPTVQYTITCCYYAASRGVWLQVTNIGLKTASNSYNVVRDFKVYNGQEAFTAEVTSNDVTFPLRVVVLVTTDGSGNFKVTKGVTLSITATSAFFTS